MTTAVDPTNGLIQAVLTTAANIPDCKLLEDIVSMVKLKTGSFVLADKGYETAFFHGAPNGSMGFNSFANLAGFDDYFGKDEYNNDDDYDNIDLFDTFDYDDDGGFDPGIG